MAETDLLDALKNGKKVLRNQKPKKPKPVKPPRNYTDAEYRKKAMRAPGHLTEDQWVLMKQLYRNKCVYCNTESPLTRDHITPLSRGGTHSWFNVVPACVSCNSSKCDLLLFIEWMPPDPDALYRIRLHMADTLSSE